MYLKNWPVCMSSPRSVPTEEKAKEPRPPHPQGASLHQALAALMGSTQYSYKELRDKWVSRRKLTESVAGK